MVALVEAALEEEALEAIKEKEALTGYLLYSNTQYRQTTSHNTHDTNSKMMIPYIIYFSICDVNKLFARTSRTR